MQYDADIAPTLALIADRTRAVMLAALLPGRPMAAGELARVAGVNPATASAHLAKLLDGGMIGVTRQGRHRFYRLASSDVADAIEAVSRISPDIRPRSLRESKAARALADARSCYDHLAGRAGVTLHDNLVEAEWIACDGGAYDVTSKGDRGFAGLGIDLDALRRLRRRFVGTCLDWTERRPHLSGALGAALLQALLDDGWVVRGRERRALTVTAYGQDRLDALRTA